LKRLLAYSSIAHAGYSLLGVLAFQSAGGREALLLYVTAYGLASLAAFAVVLYLTSGSAHQYERDSLSVLDGLSSRRPLVAIAMAFCMLSLAGMPPFVGFAGKLALLRGVLDEGFVVLAVVAVLNTLVSLYYYFSVLYRMFALVPDETLSSDAEPARWGLKLSLSTLALLLLVLGLQPGLIYPLIQYAATAVM
jgi:NADH-quinone oxidoreductase subunit N